MKGRSGIYAIRRLIDGLCYVGSSSDIEHRWVGHCRSLDCGSHHARYLQRSWTKHGADAHEFVVLEECEPRRDVLVALEQKYIDALQPAFNTSRVAGSRLGVPQPRSAVERVSRSNVGSRRSTDTRAKMSAWQKGKPKPSASRPCGASTRERLRAALAGRIFSKETRAKMSASAKVRRTSQATRQKLREKQLGRRHSDATRAKMSAALIGNTRALGTKQSAEHIRRRIHSAEAL